MATALINETRFGSRGLSGIGRGLPRRALPIPRAGGGGQEISPIPLEYELAFERGEIPGRTYKDIVDQAIETVRPGTALERQLLREQSSAIRRMNEEQERAIKEGRKLRRLQAEVKASSTLGNTANDAVSMFNFWINEAKKAEGENDYEYALEAYRNAGNQRTIAEKRSLAESKRGTASGNKAQTQAVRDQFSEFDAEDEQHKTVLRIIDETYQQNGQTGLESDQFLAEEYNTRVKELKNRMSILQDLQRQGLSSANQKSVDNELRSTIELLKGDPTETGEGRLGAEDLLGFVQQRVNNPDSYGDFVVKKTINTDVGQQEVFSVERRTIPPDTKKFIKDEQGRYIELQKVINEDGSVSLLAQSPYTNPDGSISVRSIRTEPLLEANASDGIDTILSTVNTDDLAWFGDDDKSRKDLGELNPKLNCQVNFGNEELTPEFLFTASRGRLDASEINDIINQSKQEQEQEQKQARNLVPLRVP